MPVEKAHREAGRGIRATQVRSSSFAGAVRVATEEAGCSGETSCLLRKSVYKLSPGDLNQRSFPGPSIGSVTALQLLGKRSEGYNSPTQHPSALAPSSLGRLVLPVTYAVGLDVEAEVSESLNMVEPDGSDAPVACEANDRIAWWGLQAALRLCCLSEYLSLRGQTFPEAGEIVRLFLEQLEDDVGALCAVRL